MGKYLYVNVYSVELMYGGPEEGGWWFDVGTFITGRKVKTRRKAWRIARRLEKHFPNTKARESVLGGEDYSVYIEDEPGRDFPERMPHYE